jgi:hypothetical protein
MTAISTITIRDLPNISYGDFVKSRFKTGTSIIHDAHRRGLDNAFSRLHAVIGLITELDEIQFSTNNTNLIEEVGDYYFYLAALCQYVEPAIVIILEAHATWEEARHSAAILLDLCKRESVYAKELNEDQIATFVTEVQVMRAYFNFMLTHLCLREEQIQESNRAKLEKRYPAGYTNDAAVARADKKEGEL